MARASSPWVDDHGQDGRATEEAEVARASSPWGHAELVTLAPTGSEPAAVEEATERATRNVTNEPSIPAELRPLTTDHGRRTTDETNEAITPGRGARRPMPAASVTALAMLAVLLTAGLAQVSGALFQARGTSPIAPRDQRPGHAKVAAGPQAPGGPAAIGREISRDETGPDGALPPRGDPLARARAIARPPDPAQTLPVRSRRQDGTGRTGLVAGTTGRRRSIVVNWRWSPVHPRSRVAAGVSARPESPQMRPRGAGGARVPAPKPSASDSTMSSPPFVHLHCHSHYSLLDGASKIPALVQRVKALGMPAVALTDHGNLYGAIELLRESKAAGILPIVGMEAYVAPGRRTERSLGGISGQEHAFHLTLLARNAAGFRNLMRLSSLAFLEGFYYKPRIDKEILERHADGLICLSGCASAEFSDYILHGKLERAEQLCAWYQKIFGAENFYVEIQDNGVAIQRDCAEGAIDIARRMGLPMVATSDAHYLTRDDAAAHDVLLCISTGKTIDDPTRMRFETQEFFVRSPDEMYAAMPGHDEALAASARIAAMIEPHYESFGLGKRCFPSFSPPDGKTPEDYLRELCEAGLRDRYGDHPGPEVHDRLDHELGIINRMGFASYFLIVWDFVRYARERGIPALARGSACGAIVSYVLRLSSVCPLKYDLLFERFLDPNRSEAPDIDIDLCQERRYEVIDYVRKKYGDANVAQIVTFGTLKAKAAIKDVGRAMNIPLARVEQINKLVPQRLNITLDAAIEEEPALKKLADDDPEVARLLDFARRLEGMNRNPGTHAAGVVIADRPLEELVPLQKLPNKDKAREVVTTQWEMGDIEKAGLLKMDFLGLRNLTTLAAAVRIINARHPDSPLDLERLPLDDPKTFEIFQKGETKGVFQFESAGIRDLLIKMRPDRFTDVIATNALYRPGPLNGGMVDEFVNIKNGRKQAVYLHPVLKEVLEETYGIMCYQEQVMRILNRLGGIELSRAYATIKAISKKKADVIAQGRDQFVKGAVERGLERDRALKIFDLIEYFGGYGFNKSHSTAYALVAYQTAYLKAHYPTEYMAAVLSNEMDGAERDKFLPEHIEDCRRMELEVLPPNINQGQLTFRVAGEGRIDFGLGAIKGVGFKAVEAIIKAREEKGPFTSLDDFFERVSTKDVGAGCVETLIHAGAFDSLGAKRAQLLAILPKALQAGQAKQEDRRRGQLGLFDVFEAPGHAPGPTATATATARRIRPR